MFKTIKKILIGIFISSFFITLPAYGKSCKFLFWSPIEFLRKDPNINMSVTADTFSLDEKGTWTGQNAARYEFTGQPIVDPVGKPGDYNLVTALYRNPDL